jgi:hypothetical protein
MTLKYGYHRLLTLAAGVLMAQDACPQYATLSQSYGMLTTIAGKGDNCRSDSNGWLAEFEGKAAISTDLSSPHMAMADSAGNIYIADKDAHAIRKVDTRGIITTVAGTSVAGDGADGAATEQQLFSPNDVWVNKKGEFYALDLGNSKIRKVDLQGRMTTLFKDPAGMSVGRGLWVNINEDTIWYSCGSQLRKWTNSGGVVVYADGFNALGNIVQDANGHIVATDRAANLVYRLDQGGNKTVIAGTGAATGGGDGFTALETAFYGVRGVWFLADNTYFLATHEGSQVWYIDSRDSAHLFLDGLAGDGYHSGDGENYRTPGFKVSEVRSVTVDYQGNVIVAENDCGFIRKVAKRNVGVLNKCAVPTPVALKVYSTPSGSIRIKAKLSTPGKVCVRIFDQRGRAVDVSMVYESVVGNREIHWQSGKLPSGVYSIELRTPRLSLTRTCAILH